ncbi:MAG: quorum-sensing autoinducer CAI-1 synthase [Ramlibacter sp.]|nr:quorum-sensing autoinducer CAI-1 synthase [Ramlibacter sp.]
MEVVGKQFATPPIHPPLGRHLKKRLTDFAPRLKEEWGGKFVTHGRQAGPEAVRLDGNDYLSVTGHPDIVNAQINALRQDAEFVIQSGVFHSGDHPAGRLEKALARWMGKDDGYLCQSGYTANLGLIQVVADAQTPVYIDMMAHMSLWEGARASGAPIQPFRHNDAEHLAKMTARHGPGLVIVDSVYSTTGAVCPLLDVVKVAEDMDCMILVDESHSLGTHGPSGAGLCAALGLTHRVHFITASLAKAFAGRAGFFTAPPEIRNYLMCHSFPGIFSSALLPHEVAGLGATLEVIRRGDEARTQLNANTVRVRASLSDLGYPIHHGSEQIISLEAGLEKDTLFLRDALEERGIFGAVFCAPATSKNRAMVRLTLNAALTNAEMDHLESVAREVAPMIRPWDWPIAKRNRSHLGH